MDNHHKTRHDGIRWQIVFGSFAGPERAAVIELQRAVQNYLPYVVEVVPVEKALPQDRHVLLVGTTQTNSMLADLVQKDALSPPPGPQGYSMAAFISPYAAKNKALAIAGADAAGVLYGVMEMIASILPKHVRPNYPHERRACFDGMADFSHTAQPLIRDRGLWTWGYVIYDYRRYLQAMARLRLNMLTVWNDVAPTNLDSVIEHAHCLGIKVVVGFPWGWGSKGLDLSKEADCEKIRASALETYIREYKGLPVDGVYFQTLTEHKKTEINGRSVASLVCNLVNRTAASLLEIEPGLKIQFGLHASSIADKYKDLNTLDPRVVIVWEDAGLLPYSYQPSIDPDKSYVEGVKTFEQTLAYSKALATLRPGARFGMVPKGWAWLDWEQEFEHHGPFILGERDPRWIAARALQRQDRWDWLDAAWANIFPLAARFYKEISDAGSGLIVTGLVEDGMIEEKIPTSLAVFAETLWNPRREPSEIMAAALSPFYR